MKKKIILSSILVIVLCLCVVVGSTFALFTEETRVNIAATAGNLDVKAEIVTEDAQYRSLGETFKKESALIDPENRVTHFVNGGTAEFDGGKLILSKVTPGDAVKFDVKVTNNSDVAVKYTARYTAKFVDKNGNEVVPKDKDGNTVTGEMLKVKITYNNGLTFTGSNEYAILERPGSEVKTAVFTVEVEFPNGTEAHDNQYQGLSVAIDFVVEVVQYNGVDANGNLIG